MNKRWLIALPLVLSSLAAWYFYQRSIEPPVTVAKQGAPVEVPSREFPDEPAFAAQGDEAELDSEVSRQWASGPAARRVVEVPPGASPDLPENRFDDIRNIEDHELEAFTDHNLQKALEGDLNAANRVVHAHRRCVNAPRTAQQLERQVERTVRRFEWAAQNGRGRDREMPSEEELRARYSEQYDSCQFMERMFTQDLRQQLESMANRGHVTARYLFALWPPEIFGKSDAFLAQQEWAEKALAYTLANLTEGETAGLLAFGQSYANNGTFTARDRYLGTAFIMAALDCGLDLEYYANYIDRFLNSDQFSWDMGEDARAQVLVMADGLRSFCR